MKYSINVAVGFVLAIALAASTLFSQASKAEKPSFEVASVKRNSSGANPGSIGPERDGLRAINATLTMLVQFAYRKPTDQRLPVLGAPSWMDSEHFDIEAKAPGESRRVALDEMRPMLQSLLEDRFQLKAHRETKELPVYTLSVGKDGPKVRPSSDESKAVAGLPTGVPTPSGGFIARRGSDLVGTAVDMSFLVSFLAQQVDHYVIDKTKLKGPFDFTHHYTVDPRAFGPGGPDVTTPAASNPSGPSIFTAVQEIGLKLEASKGPVEVVVIDSVQRPTEN